MTFGQILRIPEAHGLVALGGRELLRDDLGHVVGAPGVGGLDVGEGPGDGIVPEAGVVADGPGVRIVASPALK